MNAKRCRIERASVDDFARSTSDLTATSGRLVQAVGAWPEQLTRIDRLVLEDFEMRTSPSIVQPSSVQDIRYASDDNCVAVVDAEPWAHKSRLKMQLL